MMSKHRAPHRWILLLGSLLLLTTGRGNATAQTVPPTPPAPLCQGWTPLPITGGQPELSSGSIAVRASNDIWNVGSNYSDETHRTITWIRHWNGSVWREVPSPNPQSSALTAVVAPAADDAWAIGYTGSVVSGKGLILHWDGTTWQEVPAPPLPGVELHALAATGRDDVWAVGGYNMTSDPQALVLHWDGHTWSQAVLPAGLRPLYSITALSRDNLWVPANDPPKKALLLHWDGTIWSQVTLPIVGSSYVSAVAGSGPSDVWAVGFSGGSEVMVLHWDGHTWSRVPFPVLPASAAAGNTWLHSVAVVNPNEVWIAAQRLDKPLLFHWNGTTWSEARDPLPTASWADLTALSVVGGELWAAGTVHRPDALKVVLHRSPGPCTDSRTFPQTGHTIADPLLAYWEEHGALAQQGYPLTELHAEASPTDGKMYQTQYFERAVFEQHPENAPPYDILLSLLGVEAYAQRYGTAGAPNQHVNNDRARLFPETGHTVGGDFRIYWEAHGGLAQQGYPISEEFQERNALNGQTYTVQYFQRAVFEYHPENAGTPYVVLLSKLGRFAAQRRGLLAP
ncbi:MAG: hypothetical protein M3Z04_11220 [Chloroflexota bacterium]|nr:hypothetical protein [Chloroflexota bacterium]